MANIKRPATEILSVSLNSNAKDARKGYKTLIRQFTPEHHPEEFEKISTAYRTITGETPRSNQDYPLYEFPLTFLEQKIKDKEDQNIEDKLLPLSTVPESIFNIDFELEKIIE